MANKAVFGIYNSRAEAETAIDRLRAAGFRATDISVLLPENLGNKDIGVQGATKAPEGATAGGVSGATIGGVLGWLAGIGSLAIPGVGPLIAAGPIVGALAGLGAGGAAGALVGALAGYGIPEYEAKRYEGRVRRGGVLMSVHADDAEWVRKAKATMSDTGAEDISSAGEVKGDFANSDRPHARI
jgi:hypothetical protein